MAIITKASAKNYFLTGNFPTQSNFADTIDSYLGLGEGGSQTVSGPVAFGSDISVSGNTVLTGKLTGSNGAFASKLSAKGGLNTTVVSANSINTTGDISATSGRITTSAATIGNTVSASTLFASTVTVSGASITGVKGNTTIVASTSGAVTSGHLATWDTSGNLTDGGAVPASPALVKLSTVNASNQASVVFNSTYITNTYQHYIIMIDSLYGNAGSEGGALSLTFSTDNGSTYLNSNYVGGTTTYIAVIPLNDLEGTTSAICANAVVDLINPSAAAWTLCHFRGVGITSAPASVFINNDGGNKGTTPVNNILFTLSTGNNFTGNFHLYGVVN